MLSLRLTGSIKYNYRALQVQKEALARSYANKKFEQPYQTALYTASVICEVKRWHISEYEAVIGGLTLEDLQVAK